MIILGNRNNGSIGDCLWLTPAFKKFTGRVQLHDDSQCRRVSVIYKNICDVEFCETPTERIDKIIQGDYPVAQKVLDYFGIKDVNCIPFIKLEDEEIKWAQEALSKYENPVAILPDNSGTGRTDNPSALYREVPIQYLNYIAKELTNKGYTPIQFGLTSNHNDIECAVKMLDLTIRQLAACYKVTGKHIGGDTGGGCHLALSAGSTCYVLIPDHNRMMGYNYNQLLFHDHLWKDEPVRVKYINFRNYKETIAHFK